MNRCSRCGKLLSNGKSIERGYGPTCWKKVGGVNLQTTVPDFDEGDGG